LIILCIGINKAYHCKINKIKLVFFSVLTIILTDVDSNCSLKIRA